MTMAVTQAATSVRCGAFASEKRGAQRKPVVHASPSTPGERARIFGAGMVAGESHSLHLRTRL